MTGDSSAAGSNAWACVVALLCAVSGFQSATAGESAVGAGYFLTYWTNPTLSSTQPQSDVRNAAFVGLAYAERTAELEARLLTHVETREYRRFDELSDTSVYIDGSAVWTISPQQFYWTVADRATDARVDITRADTPDNRTQVNAFTTGPDLRLRLGAVDSLLLGSRYGTLDTDDAGSSENTSAYARWAHKLGAPATLSLNYSEIRSDLRPVQSAPDSVVRSELLGRYEWMSPQSSFTFDAGMSTYEPDNAPRVQRSLMRLSAVRRVSQQSEFQASYRRGLSDTFSDLILSTSDPNSYSRTWWTPGIDVLTTTPYYNQRGEISYSSTRPRYAYYVSATARRVDYQTTSPDYEELGARIDWRWRASGTATLTARATYAEREFPDTAQRDVEREGSVGVSFILSQNLTTSFEAARVLRESTVPAGNFASTRLMWIIGYSTGRLFEARPARDTL